MADIRLICDDKVAFCFPILAIMSLEYFCLFCWMKTLDTEKSLSFHENEAPPEMDLSFLDLSLRKTEVAKVCFVPTDIETEGFLCIQCFHPTKQTKVFQ
jgi:hypothetical protein